MVLVPDTTPWDIRSSLLTWTVLLATSWTHGLPSYVHRLLRGPYYGRCRGQAAARLCWNLLYQPITLCWRRGQRARAPLDYASVPLRVVSDGRALPSPPRLLEGSCVWMGTVALSLPLPDPDPSDPGGLSATLSGDPRDPLLLRTVQACKLVYNTI
ncbi:putative protocadherin-like wing polarity protein stan-like 3 [Homarus americanus]|uniref:Putative protocadherin-like wing polarity protein stan-like 3 n=1 Tax=Homarus americanus TaxID=6706 RepID=A0A8J5K4M7_HOMAM|nr:putative protocadherin-like wing polarity protein stan-like 3 [Homarus americanus]